MGSLEFLYKTAPGRIILKPLISKPVSSFSGWLLDRKVSKVLIKSFVKNNNIDLRDYQTDNINCFNDFFCRRIKDGLRPFDTDPEALTAPCDGLLRVHKIADGTVLGVKQSKFTIKSLLRDDELAASFDNGYAFVYRLCVNHYHRYAYFDSGHKLEDRRIDGVYHTVRPIALEEYPVFVENTREYAVIDSEVFGRCVQMEVGAMLVGRIVNDHPFPGMVERGMEKGHFEYGGSTIIVLIPEGSAQVRADLIEASTTDKEIPVVMGEKVGSHLIP